MVNKEDREPVAERKVQVRLLGLKRKKRCREEKGFFSAMLGNEKKTAITKQKAVDLIKTDKLRVEQGRFLRTLATDPKRGKKRA